MAYSTLKLEIESELALLTLCRPERRNAISPRMIEELLDALGAVESSAPRVAILTGEGSAFCAGMDLEALRQIATLSL